MHLHTIAYLLLVSKAFEGTGASLLRRSVTEKERFLQSTEYLSDSDIMRWITEPNSRPANNGALSCEIHVSGGVKYENSFLAASPEGQVIMYHTNDGSGRQRWEIVDRRQYNDDGYNIQASGGTNPGEYFLNADVSNDVNLACFDDGSSRQKWNFRHLNDPQVPANRFHILSPVPTESDPDGTFLSCEEQPGIAHGFQHPNAHLWGIDDSSGRQKWDLVNCFIKTSQTPVNLSPAGYELSYGPTFGGGGGSPFNDVFERICWDKHGDSLAVSQVILGGDRVFSGGPTVDIPRCVGVVRSDGRNPLISSTYGDNWCGGDARHLNVPEGETVSKVEIWYANFQVGTCYSNPTRASVPHPRIVLQIRVTLSNGDNVEYGQTERGCIGEGNGPEKVVYYQGINIDPDQSTFVGFHGAFGDLIDSLGVVTLDSV